MSRTLFPQGIDTPTVLRQTNQLREAQERQAQELRELAERVAGIAGVADRPRRLWVAFMLVGGGTVLAGVADIYAAASC